MTKEEMVYRELGIPCPIRSNPNKGYIKQDKADEMITLINEIFGRHIPLGSRISHSRCGTLQKSQGAYCWEIQAVGNVGSSYPFYECLRFLKKHRNATMLDGELILEIHNK